MQVRRYQPGPAQLDAPVGNAELPGAASALSQKLAGFADDINRDLDVEAAEAGKRAGQAAAAGRIGGVEIPDPEGMTIRERGFAEGAKLAHAAAIQTDIRTTVADLENRYPNDIAGFNAELEGYSAGLLGEVDEGLKPLAKQELLDYSLRSRVRIEDTVHKEAQADQLAAIQTASEGFADDALIAAYQGDTDLMMSRLAHYHRTLDTAVEARLMSKEGAEEAKRRHNEQIDVRTLTGVFDRTLSEEGLEAAENAYERFHGAKHKDLEVDVRDDILAHMRAELSRARARERADLARTKAARLAVERRIADDVKDAEYALDRGYSDIEGLGALASVSRGTKYEDDVATVQAHMDAVSEFVALTPQNQDELLARRSKQKKSTGREIRLLERLRKVRDHTRAELAAGRGLDLALQQGIIEELAPLDDLPARREQSETASGHYGQPVAPLLDSEIDTLRDNLDEGDTDARGVILGHLVEGLGDTSLPVLESLGGNKHAGTYAIAGDLMRDGRGGLARDVLKGIDARGAYSKIVPTDFGEAFNDYIGLTYRESDKQAAILAQAAANLYARRASQAGDFDAAATDTSRVADVMEELTGGVFTLEDQGEGFFSDPNYQVEAPAPGVDQDAFEDWLESVTAEDVAAMGYNQGAEALADVIRRQAMTLSSLGNGRYLVYRHGSRVINPDASPFVLEFPRD